MADWYSTFSALAGVDPMDFLADKANLPPIDSLNMWPLISGQNSTSFRVDILISNNTLISGDYKILTGVLHEAGWTGPGYPNNTKTPGIISISERVEMVASTISRKIQRNATTWLLPCLTF